MRNFSSKKKASWRHTHKTQAYKTLGLTVVGGIFIVYFGRVILAGVVAALLIPFGTVAYWYDTSTHTLSSYMRGIDVLREERDTLLSEQKTYASLVQENTILTEENQSLRGLLHMNGEITNRIGATVLLAPPTIPYDILLIDQGYEDGIKKNALVYGTDTYVIGVISEVFAHNALVQLFSSPQAQTTVYIPALDMFALTHGRGGGSVVILVPQEAEVSVGEMIVFPGQERAYIGAVTHIAGDPRDPEKELFVQIGTVSGFRFVAVEPNVLTTPTYTEVRAILDDTIDIYESVSTPTSTIPLTESVSGVTQE